MAEHHYEESEHSIISGSSRSSINDDYTYQNAITGDSRYLYYQLKMSILYSEKIDIVVSFLMESGVRLILDDLRRALDRGVHIRILTGNYLGITQPSALYLLKSELQDRVDLRFYNDPNKSFHPKAYIFHKKDEGEIYIGSSNLSHGALTSSIEWNYRLCKSSNQKDFSTFYSAFEDLFYHHSYEVTDKVLLDYSRSWKKPSVQNDLEKFGNDERKIIDVFKPQGAQIEALYVLDKNRKEGFDKGLVVAATGIGKTYLAAFDSVKYSRVLFVAHREEILRQAADSFYNVRQSRDYGFFTGNQKDTGKSVIFALVESLGKEEYLNSNYFAEDYFDYLIIDEFHHAVSKNYTNVINYFKPKYMLGLTATPERLDAKNVFEICDYNTVYELRLKDAINKGWLVPFRYYGIYDETVDYDTIHFINGKYNDKDLEEALMLNKRSELIYKHYKKYKSKRALGFCSSKLHAEFMAGEFCKMGIPSAAVYSGTNGEYSQGRREAVKNLIDGSIKVIFSVDMFNEGLDIKSVDMVLFLRPTQSPTVFLQQLGRGLRKSKGKEYLNVLDFIGNYKKANLVPFFLSGQMDAVEDKRQGEISDYEFPDDCYVDFDLQLIDIFKRQTEQETSIKDKIRIQFDQIREELGHVPSRMELFTYMDTYLYDNIRTKKQLNIFSAYLDYLREVHCISPEEEILCAGRGKDFIHMIETTSMSKTYKMPLLLAFYNEGNIKMHVTDEDVYQSFYDFYHKGTNKVDMLRDKSTKGFEAWDRKKYIKLAMDNPIHFMLKTHSDFFIRKEGVAIALTDDLKEYLELESFKAHMKDAIDYRVITYYRNRGIEK